MQRPKKIASPGSFRFAVCLGVSAALFAAGPALAQEYTTVQEDTEVVLAPDAFSRCADRDFPQRPLWGDSHLHAMVSVDAGTMARLTPNKGVPWGET